MRHVALFLLLVIVASLSPRIASGAFRAAMLPSGVSVLDPLSAENMEAMIGYTQAMIGNDGWEWVERASIDKVLGEHVLSQSLGINSNLLIETGHLLKADVLIVMAFDPAKKTINFRITDATRGARIGEFDGPAAQTSNGQLKFDPELAMRNGNQLSRELAKARRHLESLPKNIVLAPLYIQDTGSDDRITRLSDSLYRDLLSVFPTDGILMLDFSGARDSTGELDLALMGLAKHSPEAWRDVADAYVWGEIYAPDPDTATAVQDITAECRIYLWPGYGELLSESFTFRVGDYPSVPDMAKASIIRMAGQLKPATTDALDSNARTLIIRQLEEKADNYILKLREFGRNRTTHPIPGGLYNSAIATLETALFFSPENKDLRKKLVNTRWNYYPSTDHEWDLSYRLGRAQGHIELAQAFPVDYSEPLWHANPIIEAIGSIRSALYGVYYSHRMGKLSPILAQSLHEELLQRFTDCVLMAYQGAKNDKQRKELNDYLKPILDEMYTSGNVDVAALIRMTEALKDHYIHANTHLLFRFYDAYGNGARVIELAAEANRSGNPVAAPPPPQSPLMMRRKVITGDIAFTPIPRDNDFWSRHSSTKTPYGDTKQLPGYTERTSFWPADYYMWESQTVTHPKNYAETALPINLHRVQAVVSYGNYLFIAETAERAYDDANFNGSRSLNNYLWCFDTVTKDTVEISGKLSQPFRVITMLEADGILYLGLEGGGLGMLDIASGTLTELSDSAGLSAESVSQIVAGENHRYLLGFRGKRLMISRLSPSSTDIFPIPPFRPLNVSRQPVASTGGINAVLYKQWLVVSVGSQVGFFNTETNVWEQFTPVAAKGISPLRAFGEITALAVSGDDLYFGTDKGLIRLRLTPPQSIPNIELYPHGKITALLPEGNHLWLAIANVTDKQYHYSMSTKNENAESTLVKWDPATDTWLAQKQIVSQNPTHITPVGNDLWLTSAMNPATLMRVPLLHADSQARATTASATAKRYPTPAFATPYPLHHAIANGDIGQVKALLAEAAAPVNQPSQSGWTPLMVAAARGDTASLELLLASGATDSHATPDGYHALHLAVLNGHLPIVQQLLDAGVDVNLRGSGLPMFIQRERMVIQPENLPPPDSYPPTVDPVTDLQATVDRYGRVTLTWKVNPANIAFYEIQRMEGDSRTASFNNQQYAIRAIIDNKAMQFVDEPFPTNTWQHFGRAQKHIVDQSTRPGQTWTYLVYTYNGNPSSLRGPASSVTVTIPSQLEPIPGAPSYESDKQADDYRNGLVRSTGIPLGQTPLAVAARVGDSAIAEYLIQRGADLTIEDNAFRTPAVIAAQAQNIPLLTTLLDRQPNLPAEQYRQMLNTAYSLRNQEVLHQALRGEDYKGGDGLIQATRTGRIEDIKAILKSGGNPNIIHSLYLNDALAASAPEVIDAFLESGFTPDVIVWSEELRRHRVGNSLLINAIKTNNIYLIEKLIAYGVDLNRVNFSFNLPSRRQTPLMMAAETGRDRIVRLLLDAGADQHARDNDGQTAYELASQPSTRELLHPTAVAATEPVIGNTAGIATTDAITEFFKDQSCSFNGPLFAIDLFLAPKYRIPTGETAKDDLIHHAAISGDRQAIEKLLQDGADINATGSHGRSPLVYALMNKHTDLAMWLIEQGAAVNDCTQFGTSALTFAVNQGDTNIVKAMLRRGASPNLSRNGAPTPLMLAAHNGDHEIAALLIEYGANPNLRNTDFRTHSSHSGSPLTNAAKKNNVSMLNYLVEQGADINAIPVTVERNDVTSALSVMYGHSALAHAAAAENDAVDAVQYLLQKGADISLPVSNGNTPLRIAQERGNVKAARLLQQAASANN